MKCDNCGGEMIVLRFRKGAKRNSTTYRCTQCRRVHAEWYTVENEEDK